MRPGLLWVIVATSLVLSACAFADTFTYGTAPDLLTYDNGTVSDGQHLYRIGDAYQEANAGTMERYDPVADSWSLLAAPPVLLEAAMASVYLNGNIYVLPAVYEGAASTHLYIYNIEEDSWSQGADHPGDPFACGLVVYDGKLYKVGGSDGLYSTSGDVVEYDPEADEWTNLETPMITPRFFQATWAYDNKIYVAGGLDGAGNAFDSVEVYNIATGVWTTDPESLPYQLWATAFFKLDGVFYMTAGAYGNADSTYFTGGVRRNMKSTWPWEVGHSPAEPVHRVNGARLGNVLYIVNGNPVESPVLQQVTIPVKAPAITAVTPDSGLPGQQVPVSITGDHFVPDNLTLKLDNGSKALIEGQDVRVQSATRITATFDLTSAEEGAYDVVVTNDYGEALQEDGFLVGGDDDDDDDIDGDDDDDNDTGGDDDDDDDDDDSGCGC